MMVAIAKPLNMIKFTKFIFFRCRIFLATNFDMALSVKNDAVAAHKFMNIQV